MEFQEKAPIGRHHVRPKICQTAPKRTCLQTDVCRAADRSVEENGAKKLNTYTRTFFRARNRPSIEPRQLIGKLPALSGTAQTDS